MSIVAEVLVDPFRERLGLTPEAGIILGLKGVSGIVIGFLTVLHQFGEQMGEG